MNRRGFLTSCIALAAAPAIVRADALMRVIPTDAAILTPLGYANYTYRLETGLGCGGGYDTLQEIEKLIERVGDIAEFRVSRSPLPYPPTSKTLFEFGPRSAARIDKISERYGA